jgi:hypothetical protein
MLFKCRSCHCSRAYDIGVRLKLCKLAIMAIGNMQPARIGATGYRQ